MNNRKNAINAIMEGIPIEAIYRWCFVNTENEMCNCHQCLQQYTKDLTIDEWYFWCKENPNIVEKNDFFKGNEQKYSIEDPIEYVISATQIGIRP